MSFRPRSKYGAVKTTVDGFTFDSKKEARRYAELLLLMKAGEVRQIVLQPVFDLFVHELTVAARFKRIAARLKRQRDPIKPTKVGTYVADFQYEEKGLSACENERWHKVIEDVKGVKTPLYRWKKKHVEAQYGIQIREV